MPASESRSPLSGNKARDYFHRHVFNRQRAGDFVYLASQVSAPAVGFVTSIIAARYLLPFELGVIQTVMLISLYCSFIHLGVFNGLNRNIAYHEAQGNQAKIQKMVDASWRTAMANAVLGIAISAIALVYFALCDYSPLYLISVAILFGVLVFSPLCTHYETIYRGCRKFMPLGIYLNIGNGVNLLLGFLPVAFGAIGLVLRNAVIPIVTFFLLSRKSPVRHKSRGRIDEIIDLARIGFPMLVTGVLYVFFTAADRSIVALTLGPTAVGELALSGMAITALQVLPMSMGALLYSRAAYIYGSSKTPSGLRRFFFSA